MTYFQVKDISRGRQDKFHELRSSVTPKIWFLTSQDKGFENLVNKISPREKFVHPMSELVKRIQNILFSCNKYESLTENIFNS